jgi:hypothetical protein
MTIYLTPLLHNNISQIAIRFGYNETVKSHIKAYLGVKWSKTHNCFYVIDSAENRKGLFNHLRTKSLYVDYSALKQPIQKQISVTKKPAKKSHLEIYKALPEDKKQLLKNFQNRNGLIRISIYFLKIFWLRKIIVLAVIDNV